jgi:hypothetical protein
LHTYNDKLAEYYARFGFARDSYDPHYIRMRREPRKPEATIIRLAA